MMSSVQQHVHHILLKCFMQKLQNWCVCPYLGVLDLFLLSKLIKFDLWHHAYRITRELKVILCLCCCKILHNHAWHNFCIVTCVNFWMFICVFCFVIRLFGGNRRLLQLLLLLLLLPRQVAHLHNFVLLFLIYACVVILGKQHDRLISIAMLKTVQNSFSLYQMVQMHLL